MPQTPCKSALKTTLSCRLVMYLQTELYVVVMEDLKSPDKHHLYPLYKQTPPPVYFLVTVSYHVSMKADIPALLYSFQVRRNIEKRGKPASEARTQQDDSPACREIKAVEVEAEGQWALKTKKTLRFDMKGHEGLEQLGPLRLPHTLIPGAALRISSQAENAKRKRAGRIIDFWIEAEVSDTDTIMAYQWAEDDFDLPYGAVRLCQSEPVSGRTYIMYHGTTRHNAYTIQASGFRRSADGMLGPGVYLSRDLEKASRYPINHPEYDRVVIRVVVKVGKVIAIRYQCHPRQKTWHDSRYGEVYDTAWVPPNCGMVKSGLEENCVWDPNRIQIINIIKPCPVPRPAESSAGWGSWIVAALGTAAVLYLTLNKTYTRVPFH
ncbi:hypothetical protein L3Q82_002632 [Scortum barcoo]|uniref:Uncharacterized protein n=1 Tax=Scortum barcoo TaxID=214431 RepID=A0ACB8VVZ9_9TELE|nr:hypothetical protein L3Q82_002632 [Scortum barcoo]